MTTYGQIAGYIGNKNLARAVGNILHNNPDPKTIPCHRVVNHAGRLAPGWPEQRVLLEEENVEFGTNGCVNMTRFQWSGEQ